MLNGSILQKLQAAHAESARPLKFGVYYKHTLVALCHALEDYILVQNHPSDSLPLMVAAFQQGKWYLQEADRYGEIAQKAEQIVILAQADAGFTEHPTSQQDQVSLVHLDASDPVAQEWHLVILSPQYSAMVLCQELSLADYGPEGQPEVDCDRKFYGFWTFEAELVVETVQIACEHIKTYDPAIASQLQTYLDRYRPETIEFEGLSNVVSTVVQYLGTTQHDLQEAQGILGQQGLHYKAIDQNLVSNEVQCFLRMAQLLDASDLSNPGAAAEISSLATTMGELLALPIWQLRRLRLAALLHRLTPLHSRSSALEEALDTTEVRLSCPLVPAAQVLRKMPQLKAIAQIITHLTERWNGTGQPAGLSGEEIPLESRILGLLAEFQYQVTQAVASGALVVDAITEALQRCQNEREQRWDPHLVDTLVLVVEGLLSGLNLGLSEQKVHAGLWLLDNHFSE